MPSLLERLTDALAGRYSVESEIGRGGMATVFLAEDVKHRRKVAIKVMNPEISSDVATERFFREIEIVAGLTHPHILPLFDSGEADGLLFCVMPYIEGESLLDRLQREKQLSLEDALRITGEVAGALSYAHERGIIHRDIKPANILIEQGHAVVADFGIARAVEQAGGARITQTGVAVGTPAYMSPEQGSGSEDVDGRTDIYALGCVLYEMLAGDPPYTGVTPLSVIKRHALEPVPNVRTVRDTAPESVEYAITRAMAKVPADRFKTATDFAAALTAEAPPIRGKRRGTVRRLIAVGSAVVLVAAGLWLSGVFRGAADTAPGSATSDGEFREIPVNSTGRLMASALSPDGEYVALAEWKGMFRIDRQFDPPGGFDLLLARVDEPDREPRLIVPVQAVYHLEWTPDGSALTLSGRVRERDGLFLIPPFGGREITRLDSTVFSVFTWDPAGRRIAGVAGGRAIQVLERTSDGTFETVANLTPEAPYDHIRYVAWSPDGERLATVLGSFGKTTLWTIALDGSYQNHVATEETIGPGITWSASGDALYYAREAGGNEVFRLNISADGTVTGDPVLLRGDCAGLGGLSADGRRLSCGRSGGRRSMWLRSTDPAVDSVQVAADTPGRTIRGPSISPDGERIAYVASSGSTLDLHVFDLTTGTSRQLTHRGDVYNRFVPWSPDGRYIAYATFGATEGGNVWFVPADGGQSVRADGVVGGGHLSWAPGIDPLVSTPDYSNLMVLDPPVQPWSAALASGSVLSGIETHDLAQRDSLDGRMIHSATSPDGGRLAVFWNRGPALEGSRRYRRDAGIWIISHDGTLPKLVHPWRPGLDRPEPIRWTADGSGLYFRSGPEIHILEVDTGDANLAADFGKECTGPIPGDGRFVCLGNVRYYPYVLENFDPRVAALAAPDDEEGSEATGPERRETQLTDHGRVWQVSPAISPDGKFVAYSVADRPRTFAMQMARNFNQHLMVAAIDDRGVLGEPELLTLMQDCYLILWSPDGRHLLVSGVIRESRGMFLVPIAGGRINQVSSLAYGVVDWAPDGSRLAVRSRLEIGFLEPLPGASDELTGRFELPAEYRSISSLAWSPDGGQLAVGIDSSGVAVLWTVGPDGSGARRLSSDIHVEDLAWAPGGDALYYSRAPDRELIRLGPLDGGGETPAVQRLVPSCRWFSASDDGRRLACQRVAGTDQIWLKSLEPAADSVLLTANSNGAIGLPQLSPDGKRIAYVEVGPEGRDLHVLTLADGSRRRLTNRGDVGGGNLVSAWSPDGQYLAYPARGPDDSPALWFVPSDGGPSIRAEGVEPSAGLAWSPADHPIVQTEAGGNYTIVEPPDVSWADALGGRTVVRGLMTSSLAPSDTLDMAMSVALVVSPDGTTAAVAASYRGERGVWLFTLDGESQELLYPHTPELNSAVPVGWTPAGDCVYIRNGADLYVISRATGELTPVVIPGGICHPEPVVGVGQFLCYDVSLKADLWLIENFDPHLD